MLLGTKSNSKSFSLPSMFTNVGRPTVPIKIPSLRVLVLIAVDTDCFNICGCVTF